MKIAVEGCCHGELDKIYETIVCLEQRNNMKVDLLLICGDFQSVRTKSDLLAMAVPQNYRKMNSFYKYYSGEKKAPVLTLFIGGNHEASNYLQELPYGGWVAPNIYYLGYAGVVQFGGIRIGGISGIYKGKDYNRGHFEHPPYSEETKRTCYHVRNLEVFRLKQVKQPIDIFLSHDWPRGIYHHGNVNRLLRQKKFFREEVEKGTLGSPPLEELLHHLKPAYWFAAHLHCKFPAIVEHQPAQDVKKTTKFLALDKCLPKRNFLQVIDIPHPTDRPLQLELDLEWLTILKATNHLLNLTKNNRYMPGPGSTERWDFSATESSINNIREDFGGILKIPDTFEQSVTPYHPSQAKGKVSAPQIMINNHTQLMCEMLGLIDPFAVFSGRQSHLVAEANTLTPSDDDSLDLDERDEGIPDDSDFIDSTMETTANSNMETTANPDEISLDDVEEASADNSPEESREASPSEEPVDYSKGGASEGGGAGELGAPSMDYEKAGTAPVLSLSLPGPSSSRDLDDPPSEISSPATLSESLSTPSPEKRPQDMSADLDGSLANDSSDIGPSKPKKFKRRNASLYSSQDGDM